MHNQTQGAYRINYSDKKEMCFSLWTVISAIVILLVSVIVVQWTNYVDVESKVVQRS